MNAQPSNFQSEMTGSTCKHVNCVSSPKKKFLYQSLCMGEAIDGKKKHISKIFPLSSPFNAKMLIVIKLLFLGKSYQNLSVA